MMESPKTAMMELQDKQITYSHIVLIFFTNKPGDKTMIILLSSQQHIFVCIICILNKQGSVEHVTGAPWIDG